MSYNIGFQMEFYKFQGFISVSDDWIDWKNGCDPWVSLNRF